jgi:transketolase
MGLEDIAAFRAIHGSTVLHPCDANQTAKLVAAMADTDGISYLRTLRPATPVLYSPDDEFEVGGSRVLRSSGDDEVALVGAGITVHEALRAADLLADEGIAARVIDLYSIKPLDEETLAAAVEATQGQIVTVEDHWAEGGLGDAVASALADAEEPPRIVKLAVREMPRSGKPAECLAMAGIDAEHIAAAARRLVASRAAPAAG